MITGYESLQCGLMWTCRKCRTEHEDELRVCAACGEPFDLAPSAPDPATLKLRKIYSTTSLQQVDLLRSALRRHGIESILENEGGALFAVGMATSVVPFVITVAESHVNQAIAVIGREVDSGVERVAAPDTTSSFTCECGKVLDVPEELAGKSIECPWCGRTGLCSTCIRFIPLLLIIEKLCSGKPFCCRSRSYTSSFWHDSPYLTFKFRFRFSRIKTTCKFIIWCTCFPRIKCLIKNICICVSCIQPRKI